MANEGYILWKEGGIENRPERVYKCRDAGSMDALTSDNTQKFRMGDAIFVISDGEYYMFNGIDTWHRVGNSNGNGAPGAQGRSTGVNYKYFIPNEEDENSGLPSGYIAFDIEEDTEIKDIEDIFISNVDIAGINQAEWLNSFVELKQIVDEENSILENYPPFSVEVNYDNILTNKIGQTFFVDSPRDGETKRYLFTRCEFFIKRQHEVLQDPNSYVKAKLYNFSGMLIDETPIVGEIVAESHALPCSSISFSEDYGWYEFNFDDGIYLKMGSSYLISIEYYGLGSEILVANRNGLPQDFGKKFVFLNDVWAAVPDHYLFFSILIKKVREEQNYIGGNLYITNNENKTAIFRIYEGYAIYEIENPRHNFWGKMISGWLPERDENLFITFIPESKIIASGVSYGYTDITTLGDNPPEEGCLGYSSSETENINSLSISNIDKTKNNREDWFEAISKIEEEVIANYGTEEDVTVEGATVNSTRMVGSTFMSPSLGTSKITKCDVFLAQWAVPEDPVSQIVIHLYNHTGIFGDDGLPTGDPLASSEPINIDGYISQSLSEPTLMSFIFSAENQYVLEPNTPYCLVISANNETGRVLVGMNDNPESLYSGNSFYLNEGEEWALTNDKNIFSLSGIVNKFNGGNFYISDFYNKVLIFQALSAEQHDDYYKFNGKVISGEYPDWETDEEWAFGFSVIFVPNPESAFNAAQKGGYEGTEEEFYADLAAVAGLAEELSEI